MKLTFWGAAGTVTGSIHHVSVDGNNYLLDCGTYQGRRKEAEERNSHFPFAPASVDAVVLSHAHLDHSGNLPTLQKNGFHGSIFTTPATVDLCSLMLKDSAFLQEKDAEFLNKRHARRKLIEPAAADGHIEPLYTEEDVERTLPLFQSVPLHQRQPLSASLSYQAYDAGHILGSSALLLEDASNGKTLRLVFSGDVGRRGLPITRDPEALPPADYLIMESTYGDRLHKSPEVVADQLANVIVRTCQRGGKIIVPAFAVGRAQQLVLLLHELEDAGRIPRIPIFVDSPLAVNVTDVTRKHAELFDDETMQFVRNHEDPFGFKQLRYIRDASESKALNDLRGPFVVISASGMCEGGRILHHLQNNLGDPRNTILITGFQAQNTLGRKLVERQQEVSIFGEPMWVRAEVKTINELSGHADQHELLDWMQPIAKGLRKVFLVHGEPSQSAALAKAVHDRYGVEVTVPARGQSFEL
jgi:metallo-beta-lactamase family protein